LGIRDVDEIKAEIDALALYVNQGISVPGMPEIVYYIAQGWDGRRVFLQDGDALVYPYDRMVEVLEYLNQKLPMIERIASYGTPKDILRRTPEELKKLKDLKLGILYMGVESGDPLVLEAIGKGATIDEMIEASHRVKESGLLLSVTVILGLGGVQGSDQHALASIKALNAMDPDYAGALTLTLVPGTPMYERVRSGQFQMITPMQSIQELRLIVAESSFSNCFFSSMHASNYLSIRGTLDKDKARMLQQLDGVLQRDDGGVLRPEFLRGL
jgi:coproporphyrinogen III oxidase-like Fe-S oxidoreductase